MVSIINMVKLSNGSSVSWDEFSRWSYPKQVRNLNPPNLGKDFGVEFRKKMSSLVKEGHKNNLRKRNLSSKAPNSLESEIEN